MQPTMDEFAILGAGVSGLTVGNILLDKYPKSKVTIYAKQTTDIVSFVASAQFYPIFLGDDLPEGFDKLVRKWYLLSYKEFIARKDKGYGIITLPDYELFETEEHAPDYFYEVLPNFTAGRDDSLPMNYVYKYCFDGMVIDTSVYMPRILEDFMQKGGKVVSKTFTNQNEVLSLNEPVIFNCLGMGSKELFPDDQLKPVKGVIVLCKPSPVVKSIVCAGDFIVAPRVSDLYLGAPYIENFSDDNPTTEEVEDIFNNSKAILESPGAPFSLPKDTLLKENILEARAGFRPVRGSGPRVELEKLGSKQIIHNYGHGGNGVDLCWGTAYEAVGLLPK